MSKRIHVYGYAYTPKSYEGGTGRYVLDFTYDVSDDTDVEDFVAGIESALIDEGIKFYNSTETERGELSYAVSETEMPPKEMDFEQAAKDIMDTAQKENQPKKERKGGVQRNLTESREEESEYNEESEFERGEEY